MSLDAGFVSTLLLMSSKESWPTFEPLPDSMVVEVEEGSMRRPLSKVLEAVLPARLTMAVLLPGMFTKLLDTILDA